MEVLDIYFKNAGRGDTVFIHWNVNGQLKAGLIDCNIVNGGIRYITEHLEKYAIRELEFVIMSHPHYDHYSGFLQLFEYCEQHQVLVKQFVHTGMFSRSKMKDLFNRDFTGNELMEYWLSTVNYQHHKEELLKLFTWLGEQYEIRPKGVVQDVQVTTDNHELVLDDDVSLKFLAPCEKEEFEKYIACTFDKHTGHLLNTRHETAHNPYAVYLSALIQVYCKNSDWHILLCSDVTKFTFERISNRGAVEDDFWARKVMAVQVPNHGAADHHHPGFWDKIRGLDNTYFLIYPDKNRHIEVSGFFNAKSPNVHVAPGEHSSDVNSYQYRLDAWLGLLDMDSCCDAIEEAPVYTDRHLQVNIRDGVPHFQEIMSRNNY